MQAQCTPVLLITFVSKNELEDDKAARERERERERSVIVVRREQRGGANVGLHMGDRTTSIIMRALTYLHIVIICKCTLYASYCHSCASAAAHVTAPDAANPRILVVSLQTFDLAIHPAPPLLAHSLTLALSLSLSLSLSLCQSLLDPRLPQVFLTWSHQHY
jgi:hypothetical protein